jgi:hypothetical protein
VREVMSCLTEALPFLQASGLEVDKLVAGLGCHELISFTHSLK